MDVRLKEIHLRNIKVHQCLDILDLPETGLIVLSGPNNAGKSAILGFLMDVLQCRLAPLEKRKDYISYGASTAFCRLEFTQNLTLEVFLTQGPARECYYKIKVGATEKTYLLDDKMLPEVIRNVMSLHSVNGESIHFHVTLESKILFTNTSDAENYKQLREAVTDLDVEIALNNIKTTLDNYKSNLRDLKMQVVGESRTANQEVKDVKRLKEIREELSRLSLLSEIVDTEITSEDSCEEAISNLSNADTMRKVSVLEQSVLAIEQLDGVIESLIIPKEDIVQIMEQPVIAIAPSIPDFIKPETNNLISLFETGVAVTPIEDTAINTIHEELHYQAKLEKGICPVCGKELD